MENLLEVKGYNGQLTITERKIIITRKGLGGFISQGVMAGNKEIPIKSITAIQYRKAGIFTNGRIQFSILGEIGHKGRVISAGSDENTIIFIKKQGEKFLKAKELIEDLMEKAEHYQGNSINQISSADELRKFADLKEQGLITEQEFSIKKKELLGL